MHDRIQGWFMDEGWSLRQETVPEADWAMVAESRAGVKINARQLSGHPDLVLIFAAVLTDEETRKRLMALPADERREFLWDMRFHLLDLGVGFEGIQEPPERVIVSLPIYEDGLTKDAFLGRATQVHNATLAMIWMLARKFAQPAPGGKIGFATP